MFFLIVPIILIAAVLAWLIGRRLLARTGLPVRNILYADVGSTFPQSESLTSQRYGLDRQARLPGSARRGNRSN